MAAKKDKIFKVTDASTGQEFLVKTGNGASAIKLVVGDRFDAVPADLLDVVRLVNAGQKIIEEPEMPEPAVHLPPALAVAMHHDDVKQDEYLQGIQTKTAAAAEGESTDDVPFEGGTPVDVAANLTV